LQAPHLATPLGVGSLQLDASIRVEWV